MEDRTKEASTKEVSEHHSLPITKLSSPLVHHSDNANEVAYSDERVNISDNPIPKRGTFKAGSKLLSEISDELFDTMCDALTKNKGKQCLDQLRKDFDRSTIFDLEDEKQCSISIKHPEIKIQNRALEGIKDLNDFIQKDHLVNAFGSIANQTLGNICNLVYSQMPVHSKIKNNDFNPMHSEGAIGFPSPGPDNVGGKTSADLIYCLKKNSSSDFLLTFYGRARSKAFFVKENQASLIIIINEQVRQSWNSQIQVQLTKNKHFNSHEEISKKNAPCILVCTFISK